MWHVACHEAIIIKKNKIPSNMKRKGVKMINQKLKKLSRKELLEVMIAQGEEIERLQEQLKIAQQKLDEREICIKESGSIAEAALKLNHVFQDADNAARQYLEAFQKMVQQEQEALSRVQAKEQELQSALDQIQGEESE
jgi:hypothetical protein